MSVSRSAAGRPPRAAVRPSQLLLGKQSHHCFGVWGGGGAGHSHSHTAHPGHARAARGESESGRHVWHSAQCT
eukprot:scaffold2019_cov37-Phaeocystis_antarctica.AAC.1